MRSIGEGDKAGVALGMVGFIPLFGDAAKFPKQVERIDEALEAASTAAKARKVVRSLDQAESMRGATADEVAEVLKGMERFPAPHATGGGFSVRIPGGAVVVEAGDTGMRDIVHQGPYLKFQLKGSKPVRIPLAGNPALD